MWPSGACGGARSSAILVAVLFVGTAGCTALVDDVTEEGGSIGVGGADPSTSSVGGGDEGVGGNGGVGGAAGNPSSSSSSSSSTSPPTCSDGLANGSESDVDCGGSCPGCSIGAACLDDTDCLQDRCEGGWCVECKSHAHCPNDEYCSAQQCVPKKPEGATCQKKHECLADECDDGECGDD